MAIYPRVIYKISHDITKRMYIGSTASFKRRITLHMNALRSGRHTVEDMQKDFYEYGDHFTVEIIGEIQNIGESRKEYDFMDKYHSRIRGVGYNYKDNHGIPRKEAVNYVP